MRSQKRQKNNQEAAGGGRGGEEEEEEENKSDALKVLRREIVEAIPTALASLGLPSWPTERALESEWLRIITILDAKHVELVALLGKDTIGAQFYVHSNDLVCLLYTALPISPPPPLPPLPRDYLVVVGRESTETRFARCRSVVLDAVQSNDRQRHWVNRFDLSDAVYSLQREVYPLHQAYSLGGHTHSMINNYLLAVAIIYVATHRLLSQYDHRVYHTLLTLKQMKIVQWPPGIAELISLYVAL